MQIRIIQLTCIFWKLSAMVSPANWKIGDQNYYCQFTEL